VTIHVKLKLYKGCADL